MFWQGLNYASVITANFEHDQQNRSQPAIKKFITETADWSAVCAHI